MGTGYHGGFGDSKGNNEQEDKTTENESEDNSIFYKTTIDSNYQTLKDDYPLTKEGKFGQFNKHCRIIESDDPIKTSIDFYERIGRGGIKKSLKNGHGTTILLSDGTVITHRITTTTIGSPAVDINIDKINHSTIISKQKIHFVKKEKK